MEIMNLLTILGENTVTSRIDVEFFWVGRILRGVRIVGAFYVQIELYRVFCSFLPWTKKLEKNKTKFIKHFYFTTLLN